MSAQGTARHDKVYNGKICKGNPSKGKSCNDKTCIGNECNDKHVRQGM
jgi:hypothetical protein